MDIYNPICAKVTARRKIRRLGPFSRRPSVEAFSSNKMPLHDMLCAGIVSRHGKGSIPCDFDSKNVSLCDATVPKHRFVGRTHFVVCDITSSGW